MNANNNDNGFIVLHRSILNWEWYDDVNTTRVFIHCLLKANHTPRKWHGHLIERGQFITSLAKLAKETRLSVRELRTALNHLNATHELTSETTKQFSIITITNYALYQDRKNTTDTLNDTLNDTQATNDRQSNDTLPTTNNNNNNENNNNKNLPPNGGIMSPEGGTLGVEGEKETLQIEWEKFVFFYNKKTAGIFGTIKTPLSEKRKDLVRARMREHGKQSFVVVIEKAIASDFLKGQNKTNFHATFDWLIRPTNFEKVLSGNYDNHKPTTNDRLHFGQHTGIPQADF